MELSYDYLTIEYHSEDLSALKDTLNLKLDILTDTLTEDDTIGTCILVIGTFVPLFSVEMLLCFFSGLHASSLHVRLKKMETAGYVICNTLYHGKNVAIDSRTSTLFCITKKGYERVLPYVGSRTFSPNTKHKQLLHDYSAGFNFLALLSSPIPITTWETEYIANLNMQGKNVIANTLKIDALCVMGQTYRLFIEEDLGTEYANALIKKLDTYFYQGNHLFNSYTTDSIILSFRKPYVTFNRQPRYSMQKLCRTLALFKEKNEECDDTLSLFYKLVKNRSITVSENERKVILSCLEDLLSTYDVGAFMWENLESYIADFKNMISYYHSMDYNLKQLHFTIERRNTLIERYIGQLYSCRDASHLIGSTFSYANGLSCFTVPTSLLSQRLPYIMPVAYNVLQLFSEVLSHYYSGFLADTYTPIKPVSLNYINTDARLKMRFVLKNYFTTKYTNVYIENLSDDIGAAVRVMLTRIEVLADSPLHIILLVNDYKDALYFKKLLSLDTETNFLHFKKLSYLFLETATAIHLDQLSNHKLFVINSNDQRVEIIPPVL